MGEIGPCLKALHMYTVSSVSTQTRLVIAKPLAEPLLALQWKGAGRDRGLGSAGVLERSPPGVKYLLISAKAASGLTSTISLRLAQEARGSVSRGPGRRRTGSGEGLAGGGGVQRPTKARLWRRGWRDGGTCVLRQSGGRGGGGGGFADVADKNLSGLNDNGLGCEGPWSGYPPPQQPLPRSGKRKKKTPGEQQNDLRSPKPTLI